MRMNRRNVLVGLGTIVAGGGAALGTGAFSTVTADREIEIEIAGDAHAYLGIEPGDGGGDYVEGDDEISFNFGGEGDDGDDENGLNENAVTRFNNLIKITDNREDPSDNIDITIEAYEEGETSEGDEFDSFTAYEGSEDPNGENNLELEAGGDLDVGFEFDTRTREDHVDDDVENIDIIQIDATETSTEDNG